MQAAITIVKPVAYWPKDADKQEKIMRFEKVTGHNSLCQALKNRTVGTKRGVDRLPA